MQESEILARIVAGDTDQFGLLYDAYAEKIYRYIFYRTHDREVAEDLTSATFLKAIKNVQRFDVSKGNFSSWIYRIARNTLFDHFRTNRGSDPIEAAEDVADDTNIEREATNRELIRKVQASFGALSDDQREIVTMRVWDDLSYAEIAKVLGKSEASCKVAFYRAMVKIKQAAPLAMALMILFPSFEKFMK